MDAVTKPKTPFVLDASVTLAWYFSDEGSYYADSIAHHLNHIQPIVPSVWLTEVTNAVIMGERRGRETVKVGNDFLNDLKHFSISIVPESIEMAEPIAALARDYHLSAYDASYLYLSKRLNLPLASLDSKLKAAAEQCGVFLFNPRMPWV